MTGLGLGLPRRLHEIGRLRLGDRVTFEKKGGGEGTRPHKLDKWRLTSQHEAVITHVAEEYGGTPRVWEGAPAGPPQWEVYTDTSSLEIYIPTGGLSAAWEMWSGGGCKRRCDGSWMDTGERCACLADIEKDLGPERFKRLNASDILRERLARAKANPPRACKPMTRLSVVLPNIPPALTIWRVTTSSVNAGIEMPGTVDLLQGALSNRQLIPAHLVIEQRTQVKDGKTTIFPVPVLSLHEVTMAELGRAGAFWVLGEANTGIAQLSAAEPTPALNAGPTEPATEATRPTAPQHGDGAAVDAKATPVPGLIDRFNALPNRNRAACMGRLRDLGFPDIAADRMEEALALVASYEDGPTDPPSPPEPPSTPPTPPSPPSAGPTPHGAPEVPETGESVEASSLVEQVDAELAKAPRPPPPIPAPAGTISTWQPKGEGPPLPHGINDAMLYSETGLSAEDKALVDAAWEGGGARLLQKRLEWLDEQERAKNPRPVPDPNADNWEPGPIRENPVAKARGDLAAAKARSGR